MDSGTWFALAWRYAYRIPRPLLSGGLAIAADALWLFRTGGVRQYERNLTRALPGASTREIRRVSRRGMHSYLRYYREAFVLQHLTEVQVDARVRCVGDGPALEDLANGASVILGLGHLGNWDLAGAWAERNLGHVTTVAERLKPDELYEEFLAFRSALGMTILTFGDSGVFKTLQSAIRDTSGVVPLLADRDLGKSGVEIDLFGHCSRIAVGPAALAVTTNAPLYGMAIYYERLTGERKKAAGSSWGIVLKFGQRLDAGMAQGSTRERVAALSQLWMDDVAAVIAEHPEDWHMLQKVFVADLDPVRYSEITKENS